MTVNETHTEPETDVDNTLTLEQYNAEFEKIKTEADFLLRAVSLERSRCIIAIEYRDDPTLKSLEDIKDQFIDMIKKWYDHNPYVVSVKERQRQEIDEKIKMFDEKRQHIINERDAKQNELWERLREHENRGNSHS